MAATCAATRQNFDVDLWRTSNANRCLRCDVCRMLQSASTERRRRRGLGIEDAFDASISANLTFDIQLRRVTANFFIEGGHSNPSSHHVLQIAHVARPSAVAMRSLDVACSSLNPLSPQRIALSSSTLTRSDLHLDRRPSTLEQRTLHAWHLPSASARVEIFEKIARFASSHSHAILADETLSLACLELQSACASRLRCVALSARTAACKTMVTACAARLRRRSSSVLRPYPAIDE